MQSQTRRSRTGTQLRRSQLIVPGRSLGSRRELTGKTEVTRSRLDEPNRRYQEYLHQLTIWQKRRDEIEGTEENANSVAGLETKLAALDHLPAQIAEQKNLRSTLVREVYRIQRTAPCRLSETLFSCFKSSLTHTPYRSSKGRYSSLHRLQLTGLQKNYWN